MVSPGANFSTWDVYRGYFKALKKAGCEVLAYGLDKRISFYGEALQLFKKQKRGTYCLADIYRLASNGIVVDALRQQVDLVFIISGMYVHPDAFVLLRRAGFKIACYFTEEPYDYAQQLKLVPFIDYLFLCDKVNLERYRKIQPNTWFVSHSCDPEIHKPRQVEDKYESDVVFIGTGFPERIELFEQIDWTSIDLKIFGTWELVKKKSPIRKYVSNEIMDNLETVKYYSGAKICLNLHRRSKGFRKVPEFIDEAYALNPRTFEIASCGAFQIVDDSRGQLRDVFGQTIPTFQNAKHLEMMIKHYLRAPRAREQIAKKAQEISQSHSFNERVAFLMDKIEGGEKEWQPLLEKAVTCMSEPLALVRSPS